MFDFNFQNFHFLRPEFLYLYLICVLICYILYRSHRVIAWSKFINPKLISLLKIGQNKSKNFNYIALLCAYLIVCVALAGPTWTKIPSPTGQKPDAIVVVFDLSPSMRATDIAPSRFERAKLKLIDLLRQREEGQIALIAYAGSAHVVSPLTTDANTLLGLTHSLNTNIMPVAGSNVEQAVDLALELLNSAEISNGHIVLMTDGVADVATDTLLNKFQGNNMRQRMSILGVGTATGSPIPNTNGQFLKDRNGRVIFAKLDSQILYNLAVRTNGRYHLLTTDNTDIDYLLDQDFANLIQSQLNQSDVPWFFQQQNREWYDFGAKLLLLLLPFSIFVLRRQAINSLALISILFLVQFDVSAQPMQPQQQAEQQQSNTATLSIIDKLFLNRQQQGAELLKSGNAKDALPLLKSPEWRAAAQFYNQNFEEADAFYSSDQDNLIMTLNSMKTIFNQGDLDAAIAKSEQAMQLAERFGSSEYQQKISEYQQLFDYLRKQQQQQQDSQDQQNQEQQEQQNQEQQQQNQEQQEQQSEEQQSEQQQAQNEEESEEEQQSEAEQEQQDMPTEEELAQLKRMRWLENIKDDPSGFLRRKFQYQAQQEANRNSAEQSQRY